MKKFLKVEKITNLKFLNMYKIYYENKGKIYEYNVASRRFQGELECNSKGKIDAVRILPYIIKDGKKHVIIIKEFRDAINKYIYSLPAGLIDNNESGEVAAIRELREEIGAKVLLIEKTQDASYSSPGLTDEKIECYEARVELAYQQELEDAEDITFELVEVSELLNFVNKNQLGIQSALLLKEFYYKMKLRELENNS